jgi:hypothetical protein
VQMVSTIFSDLKSISFPIRDVWWTCEETAIIELIAGGRQASADTPTFKPLSLPDSFRLPLVGK